MTRWIACAFVPIVASIACSNQTDGARSRCAVGGAITGDCPLEDRTVEGACWRLVDCGVILLQKDQSFDWPACVDVIQRVPPQAQELIIDCIAGSTCDALKVDGSPDDPDRHAMYCLRIGGLD